MKLHNGVIPTISMYRGSYIVAEKIFYVIIAGALTSPTKY